MAKSVIIEKVGAISWREMEQADDYQPTRQEEIDHGTRVVTRHFGDPGPGEIDTGRAYERYWPMTIDMMKAGIFNLEPLITHKYEAADIATCMQDSIRREDGFIKSVFYLNDKRGT